MYQHNQTKLPIHIRVHTYTHTQLHTLPYDYASYTDMHQHNLTYTYINHHTPAYTKYFERHTDITTYIDTFIRQVRLCEHATTNVHSQNAR